MKKAINLKELLFFYFILTLGYYLYATKVLWRSFYDRINLQMISKRKTNNKKIKQVEEFSRKILIYNQ
jgi:hypothetical protein